MFVYSGSNTLATSRCYNNLSPIPRVTQGESPRPADIHLTISNTIPVYRSVLTSRTGTSTLASGDSLAPSADQDTTHLLICREGFQRNGYVPRPSACECGLSHRDLDLRRSAFRQDAGGIVNTKPGCGLKSKSGRTEGFAWRQRRTCAPTWHSALISPPGHHESDGKARPAHTHMWSDRQNRTRCGKGDSLTDVPARIGTWMSKTIIRAVKAETSSTGWVCGHSTLPVSRWMGSIAVRYSVTLDPAAAHCTLSVSVSIAVNTIRPN